MGGLNAGRIARARMTAARACFAAILMVTAAAVFRPSLVDAATVRNGSFTDGSADAPADWRNEAWSRDGVEFAWTAPAGGGSGSIAMRNVVPNDTRWCQAIAVDPGATYRVAVRARTRDVGTAASGAHIAIEPRVADSADLRGTQDWQPLEIVARAGDESQWDLCLRLGSYANLNTGSAWFTDVTVTQIGAPTGPSPTGRQLARLVEWARASGRSAVLPLIGGALLAFGLGIGRRHMG
jgi:hypothetical protein